MNFARRQECNKCGAPKPGDGGFGGGGECFRDVLLPEMFTGLSKSLLLNFYVNTSSNGLKAFW